MMLTPVLLMTLAAGCYGTIERPMGVAISMASLYRPSPSKTFRCLDGSKEVPWDHVNDDYCDCQDGSDEPGTSACPNGRFHCTNAGFRPMNILSSRVNDGICDCCDGTDEWDKRIECVNNCKELGKQAREERDKVRQLQEQGYRTKLTYIEEGKKTREEKKTELEQLEKEKVELEAVKVEMEAKKKEAEGPEKEAKEKHENWWKEELEKKTAQKDQVKALIAFKELDTNQNERVELEEIKALSQFDIDANGEVSDEEAKEHLEDAEFSEFEHFLEKVWPHIKDFYKSPDTKEDSKGDNQDKTDETEPVKAPPSNADPENFDHDEDEYDDEDVDEDDEHHDEFKNYIDYITAPYVDRTLMDQLTEAGMVTRKLPRKKRDTPVQYMEPSKQVRNKRHIRRKLRVGINPEVPHAYIPYKEEDHEGEEHKNEDDEKMPDYDEETKALMAAADVARNQFNDAEGKLKSVEDRIRSVKSYLDLDLGPDDEFGALKGNCYEYTDREYTYKLCAFDRASQRPKHGGSETTLGTWGRWDGPDNDKYAAQKYENGQNCWNGPNRSVKVNMRCGMENKVTNAFEPNRCVYEFDFLTPARCTHLPPEEHEHDEL